MQREKSRYIERGDRIPQTNNVLANENKTIWIDPSFDEELHGLNETTVWSRVDLGMSDGPEPAAPYAPVPTIDTVRDRPPARREVASKWAELEKIGLGPKPAKPASSARMAKLIVSTYRLLGFTVLTAIVVALVGYIAITLFYFGSKSWLVPTVVSATDERVVALQGELAQRRNERDRLAAELGDAERTMANEQAFQSQFAAAIQSDLRGRRSTLRRLRALAGAAKATRSEIHDTSDAFARDSAQQMESQYEVGLIDRHAMLDGKHQLAQISSSQLTAAERQVAFETQAAELARQASALDALLANKDVPLSYEVLEIKRDYDASKLAVAKASETRRQLLASLARHDAMIASLESSAYLRALANNATVALVPYANLANAAPGASLYACKLEMVWCREIGRVVEVLPGEVQLRHPHRDSVVRGQMVELQLTDATAAHEDVLFAGGRPLGF